MSCSVAVGVAGGGRRRAVPARGGFAGNLRDRNDQDSHYTNHRTERTDREAPHAEGRMCNSHAPHTPLDSIALVTRA